MLTTKIALDSDNRPVKFEAIDEAAACSSYGISKVIARELPDGKWRVTTYVSLEQLASQSRTFDNSGAAIECFTRITSYLSEIIEQKNKIQQMRNALDNAILDLEDKTNTYYGFME